MFKIDFPRYLVLGGLALAIASTTGCKKDDAKPSEAAAKPAEGAAPAAADLGAINGAVPASLSGKLSFTQASIDDEVDAVVPDGWEGSKVIPGNYRPTESDFGFFTKYSVGTNCDGMCQAKDWAATVAESEFGQSLEGATIDKDDKLEGGRVVVAHTEDRVRIIAAWWKPDAEHYVYCRAELDGAARDAAAAFEQACRATRPRW